MPTGDRDAPERATPPHAGLSLPLRVLLMAFAVPLIAIGALLLLAAVRNISAAPVLVIAIAIVQVVAGGLMALAAARGHSRFWGGESVSSILLPLVGALALVTAYDRSGRVAGVLGISAEAASAVFLVIAGIAIFTAMMLAWRRGVSERGPRPGSPDNR
jgi:hypothetical protein